MVGPRRLPRPTRPLQAGAIEATLAANRQPGFSTSQRNSCPIGQFHKPPNELPADFDNVLRPHRQTPWKLKRAAHFTPPVPDQPAQICGHWFGPNLSELQLSTQSNAVKSNRAEPEGVRHGDGAWKIFARDDWPTKNKNPELMLGVFADLIESGFNAYQNR